MVDKINIFDRDLLLKRREKASLTFHDHDFLFKEVAIRLVDRVKDINRKFPLALDLGCRNGLLSNTFSELAPKKIGTLVQADLSPGMVTSAMLNTGLCSLVIDEERLPMGEGCLDLILSCLNLHHVNDLPGTLIQICQALKPDGVFIGAIFGDQTLQELKQSWLQAESEIDGGASFRISPFVDLQNAAGLMQRAGFALPVADIDTINVTYDHPLSLMHDLKGMGETNILIDRKRIPTKRETLLSAVKTYITQYSDNHGRISATFEIIYLIGWAPAKNQQKALKPGTAALRLADALETKEISVEEKV